MVISMAGSNRPSHVMGHGCHGDKVDEDYRYKIKIKPRMARNAE